MIRILAEELKKLKEQELVDKQGLRNQQKIAKIELAILKEENNGWEHVYDDFLAEELKKLKEQQLVDK